MLFAWLRSRRRRRLLEVPFPEQWEAILERNFGHWRYLDEDERDRLRGFVRIFVAEKYWEGCGGLEMTDEVRVTIAAQACLLLLNLRHNFYRNLQSILVYPTGYVAPNQRGPAGVVREGMPVLGQAHHQGPVILSWQHARRGGQNPYDGQNLVYHEFAHKLDMKNGLVDGTPALPDRESHRRWVEVMTREYEALRENLRRGGPGRHLLRGYAATNPAEFFAVATEVFFEQPLAMRERHPELYEVMGAFYHQDPAARIERGPSGQ